MKVINRKYLVKVSLLFISVFLFSIIIYADVPDKAEYVSISPDKQSAIVIQTKSGEGDVFLKAKNSNEIKMFNAYFRYEPRITWVSNNLVEIFISTGSPNFYKRYIEVNTKRLSPEYSLAVAIGPDLKNIILLDFECIKVYKLFDEKPVKTISLPDFEPLGFLTLWNGKVTFLTANKFSISYEKPIGEKHYKEFEIENK